MSNTRWESTFESWKQGKEPFENIRKILYRYRRLNIDLEIIQSSLAPLHTHLDQELINPRLLPASLLLQPKQWNPGQYQDPPISLPWSSPRPQQSARALQQWGAQ